MVICIFQAFLGTISSRVVQQLTIIVAPVECD